MTVNATTATLGLDAERTDLLEQLASARSALTATVNGLSDAQLGETPTTSALCLGGLIKHVAAVEENWARFLEGGPSAMGYDLPDGVTWQDLFTGAAQPPQWMVDHGNQFRIQPGDTLETILERYRQVAERTAEVVAAIPDMSVTQLLPEAPWNTPGESRSMRRVLTQLVQETAQHAGHADILRESLDGHVAG